MIFWVDILWYQNRFPVLKICVSTSSWWFGWCDTGQDD